MRSDPHLLDDALFDEISHNVAVDTPSNDLFEISYANRDPEVARRIVESVVFNYSLKHRINCCGRSKSLKELSEATRYCTAERKCGGSSRIGVSPDTSKADTEPQSDTKSATNRSELWLVGSTKGTGADHLGEY